MSSGSAALLEMILTGRGYPGVAFRYSRDCSLRWAAAPSGEVLKGLPWDPGTQKVPLASVPAHLSSLFSFWSVCDQHLWLSEEWGMLDLSNTKIEEKVCAHSTVTPP